MAAPERVRLFRLARDLTGTQFGSRQTLYERFFYGDVVQLRMRRYAQYDYSRDEELVQRFMGEVYGENKNLEYLVKSIPGTALDSSGIVLYSGREAFSSPSQFYVLSINPRGEFDDSEEASVRLHINNVLHTQPGDWCSLTGESGGLHAAGQL